MKPKSSDCTFNLLRKVFERDMLWKELISVLTRESNLLIMLLLENLICHKELVQRKYIQSLKISDSS